MTENNDERYPIGDAIKHGFGDDNGYDKIALSRLLLDIQQCPVLLENAILNLDEQQLNIPYRDGGWNSKQVVHHVADSHMNAFIRFKLAPYRR